MYCTTSVNIQKYFILLKLELNVFISFSVSPAIISPHSINQLLFVMGKKRVSCKVETAFLNTVWLILLRLRRVNFCCFNCF